MSFESNANLYHGLIHSFLVGMYLPQILRVILWRSGNMIATRRIVYG